jgi:hypothetical protein
MKTEVVYVDGSPTPKDCCVRQVDHYVATFTVKVRSMNRITPERLKNVIEKSFEVVEIAESNETTFVS